MKISDLMTKMALLAGFFKSVKTDIEGRFIVQKKIIGSLLVSMAMPFSAFALSLGEIEVHSSLNQPLDAEIEIKSATARDVSKLIVKLASEQKFIESGINRPFWLTGLKFNQITKSGKPYIKITSSSAVREPFLNFLVDAEWPNGRLVREYTLLVDPPSFVTSAPVVTQTQAPVQAQASAQQGIAEIKRSEPVEEIPVLIESETVTDVETFETSSIIDETLPSIDLSMDVNDDSLDTQSVAPIETASETLEKPTSVKFDDYVVVGDSDYLGDEHANTGVESSQYTVKSGDTMSSIARQYAGNGVSLNQVMVAILKANPKAFINDNVNLVKRGARLNIPSSNDIVALSRSKALEIVKQQNALWREYRNKSVATTPTTQPELAPQQVNETPEVQQAGGTATPPETGDNQLSIVAPKTPETAKDNAELSLNDDKAVEEITRKLLLARERVAATNLREEELQSRISELESIATQSKAVLALKNQKLAQMQANAENTESNDINLDSMFGALEGDEQTAVENTTEQVQEPVKTTKPETPVATAPVATPAVDVNRPDGFLGTVYDFIPAPVKDLISPYLGASTALAVLVILGALICLPLLLLLRKKKSAVTKDQTAGGFDVSEFAQSDSLGADTTATELDSTDGFDPEAFASSGASEQASQNDSTGLFDLDSVPDDTPVSTDDLEMSDATGVTVETSDPDVVDDVTSEADMYVVYGLHDQAVELLRKSIRENPEKAIYYSKLMEVYKDQDKQLEFLEVAEDLKTMLNGKPSTSWDYAVTLGKEYAPEADIFAGVATAVSSEEASDELDVALDNEIDNVLDDTSHDLDMDELLTKTEASSTPEVEDSVLTPEEMLADMDLDGASVDDSVNEMSDQDIADISMGLTDDNIELDMGIDSDLLEESDLIDDVLGDVEDAQEALTEIPEITSAVEADGLDETIDPSMFDEMNDVAEELTKEADSLGDDLDGLDLDSLGELDDDALSTKALDGEEDADDGEMTQLIDDDSLETMIDEIDTDVASFSVADADSGFDEIGTKLDLAKAYIDMGDAEGAKESLQEVIQGGNDEQKAEAEKLLSEI